MKTKEQKQEMLDALSKQIPDASITIFTSFARAGEAGLSVAQMEELKGALREAEAEYVVAKKRLVEKAMAGSKYEGLDVFGVDGSLGLVFGKGDAYGVAKALHQFAKANPSLKLFSGLMEDGVLTPEQVLEMATLPSKDELIVRLLGMLNYPLQSLAIVLNQIAQAKPADTAPVAEEPKAEAEAPAEEPVKEDESSEASEESKEEPKKEEKPAEEKSEEVSSEEAK